MQHTKMLHAPCNINYGQPHATFDYGQDMQQMQHVACVASVAATLLHVEDSCNKSIDTALDKRFLKRAREKTVMKKKRFFSLILN